MKTLITVTTIVVALGLSTPITAQQITYTNNETGGVILINVQRSRARQFEEGMGILRRALASSVNQEVRKQAATMRVMRASEPGPGGAVLYLFVIEPPVQGLDYTIKGLADSVFEPKDAERLHRQIVQGFVGPYSKLSLHPPGTPTPGVSRITSAAAPSGLISKTGTIDDLRVTVETKVTETNTVWWKYSWKVTIKNSGAPTVIGATVEFLDADGFPLEQSSEQRTQIGADELVLTGFEMITVGVAPNVRKVDLKVRTIKQ